MNTTRLALCSALLTTSVTAQTTWVVPASQSNIQSFVDGAAPGDTLQLTGGIHCGITLDKGLTIRGPGGINAFTGGGNCPSQTIVQIPPGQHARFVDMNLFGSCGAYSCTGRIHVVDGRVSFLGCSVLGGGWPAAIVADLGAAIDMNGCDVTGADGAGALRINGGHVVATDCVLIGADHEVSPFGVPIQGMAGVTVTAGSFHGSQITARGGTGSIVVSQIGPFTLDAQPGIAALATAEVFVTDSTVLGGDFVINPGPGAPAIDTTVPVWIARTTLTPGSGAPAGPPTVGPVQTDPNLLGTTPLPAVVAPGSSPSMLLHGPVGALYAVFLAAEVAPPASSPLLRQRLWAPLTWQPLLQGVFAAPTETLPVPVPNDPSLSGQTFWFHPFGGTQFPLEVAPMFGTTVL